MSSFIPLGFFSRVLKPDQVFELQDDDLLITNITFGESVKGKARSCIKIKYSDLATPEDEAEMEIDDEDDDEKAAEQAALKLAAKKHADPSSDNEDEEDDSDIDSEDDFGAHVIRDCVIAALTPGVVENVSVNVTLFASDMYELSVTGENEVHISGQYIRVMSPYGDSDSEFDEDDDDDSEDLEAEFGHYDPELGLPGGELTGIGSLGEGDDDDEMDEDDLLDLEGLEDEEDSDVDRFEELAPSPAKPKANGKKVKIAEPADDSNDVSMDGAKPSKGADASDELDGLSKNQRKKLAKKLAKEGKTAGAAKVTAVNGTKTESVSVNKAGKKTVDVDTTANVTVETAAGEVTEKAKKSSKKVTLPSGLSYTEAKTGKGDRVKKGSKIEIRYVGKLANGKVFDKNTAGKPFRFTQGKGEVIKGLEEGVLGAMPGTERKLVIPANLAYGSAGNADIPANATLTFDIKVISTK